MKRRFEQFTLDAAQRWGREEMDRQGLQSWTLSFDDLPVFDEGRCVYAKRLIRINLDLLNCRREKVMNVVRHEIAHSLTLDPYGLLKPHGIEWAVNAIKCGVKPDPDELYYAILKEAEQHDATR